MGNKRNPLVILRDASSYNTGHKVELYMLYIAVSACYKNNLYLNEQCNRRHGFQKLQHQSRRHRYPVFSGAPKRRTQHRKLMSNDFYRYCDGPKASPLHCAQL